MEFHNSMKTKLRISLSVCSLFLVLYISAGYSMYQSRLADQSVDSLILWVNQNSITEVPDTLFAYANLALNKARLSDDPEKIGDAYRSFVKVHRALTTYDSILHYAQQALLFHQRANNPLKIADDYLSIGFAYGNKLSLLSAEENIMKAVELYESHDALSQLSEAYGLLSYFFFLSDAHKDGIKYAELSYATAASARDTTRMIHELTYSIPIYLAVGEHEKALTIANQSIELINDLQNHTSIQVMDAHYYRGDAHTALNKLDEAMQDYMLAYELAKERWKNSKPETALFFTDGLAYLQQLNGNYEEAIQINKKLLNHLYKTGEFENLIRTHHRLSQCYKEIGKYEEALVQATLAWHLEDSVKTLRFDALSSELQIRYETTKREETIQAQRSQIDRQLRTQYLSAGIAILFLLLLSVLFYNYRYKKRRNQELLTLNNSLSEKNTLLDEKNLQNETLLKEIHHRVKNNLEIVSSLLELQSAQLDNAEQQQALQSSQSRIQSMGIVHQKLYRERGLSTIEMGDYFKSLSEHILDSYDARDYVIIEYKMEPSHLDLDTAIPIGLIVNELLTNALKHAFPNDRKGRIQIQLEETTEGYLNLVVADNGIGKTSEDSSKGTGFGVQLISLLTQQLNGTMRKEVTEGTKVSFKLSKAQV